MPGDDEALGVLATVLGGGRSSRFYEQIVRQKQLASTVFATRQESRGPNLFRVSVTVVPGKSAAEVDEAVVAEIEKLKSSGVAEWEIEKARTSARRALVGTLQSSLSRAIQLSQDALLSNDPDRVNTRAARIAAVKAADVQRVARHYLTRETRAVVVTNPKAPASPGGL